MGLWSVPPFFSYMTFYPSWRYHRTEPARIVNDPAEEEALGAGWTDTPAAFDQGIATTPETEPETPKKPTRRR